MVRIRYVGKKLSFVDHLFGTGLTWEYGGDQPVSDAVAEKMLEHPEFEQVDSDEGTEDPAAFGSAALTLGILKEPEDPDALAQEAPLTNLEAMTKAELVQYAHRSFGVELDGTARKADLVDAVRRASGTRRA